MVVVVKVGDCMVVECFVEEIYEMVFVLLVKLMGGDCDLVVDFI